MRYNYDEAGEEEEDSESGVRRSTRNSGRESSAAPAGPTVTSSGRHVRSRATGMYGESLLSGQTTDHASPATGDYVRSDASEEPEQPAHGRATRAAGRGGAAPGSKRTFESYKDEMSDEEEEDATSWNGDDEEEDEADDQMDVDDEDDEDLDASDDASDAEDLEPQHLIVRLKIGKESFDALDDNSHPPKTKTEDVAMQEAPQPASSIPVTNGPPSGMDAARQHPVLAPAPAPAASAALPAPPLPPPTAPVASLPAQDASALPAAVPAVLPPMQPNGVPAPLPVAPTAAELPPLGALFRAPTPPYTALEGAKVPVPVAVPVPQTKPNGAFEEKMEPRSPDSYKPGSTAPVSANWQ